MIQTLVLFSFQMWLLDYWAVNGAFFLQACSCECDYGVIKSKMWWNIPISLKCDIKIMNVWASHLLCFSEDETKKKKDSDRNHSNGVGCCRALQQLCQSRWCHSNIHSLPVINFIARRGRQKFCATCLIFQIQNKRLEPNGPCFPAFSICSGMVFVGLMEPHA